MNLAYFIGGPLDLTKTAVVKALPNYWAEEMPGCVRPLIKDKSDPLPWVEEHEYQLINTFAGAAGEHVLLYRYEGLRANHRRGYARNQG